MDHASEPGAEHLLARARGGDADAARDLFDLLHGELRAIAGRVFRGQSPGHTLQPTAVLNEACLRMLRAADRGVTWQDRAHFLNLAARAMRQVLVNHARDRGADKRGGGAVQVSLADEDAAEAPAVTNVLDVDAALAELAVLDPRQAHIAELRFFGGLSHPEIAEVLGVSLRTVELDWHMAKAWLAKRLSSHAD